LKNFLKDNGIWLLLITVLLTALFGIFYAMMGGMADPLANLWGVVTAPVRTVSARFVSWTEGVYSYAFEHEELKTRNAELEKRVAELEKDAAQSELALQENERLRKLLGLQERRQDFTFEAAAVTSRSASNWESVITVNKGSLHGVAAGDCVIDENGVLVGVVTQVGVNWASVRTVVDADTEMGALVARTESAAIIEGDFSLMGVGELKLTYLPETVSLIAGDLVVTSGLNGTYPSGLVIGTVRELRAEPSGMGHYAVVEPRAELGDLKQVFVIKEFAARE
jgi:rod shape-determining protein MreC